MSPISQEHWISRNIFIKGLNNSINRSLHIEYMRSKLIIVAMLLLAVRGDYIYAYVPPTATVNSLPVPTYTSTTPATSNTFYSQQSNTSQTVKTPTVSANIQVTAPPTVSTPTYTIAKSRTIAQPTIPTPSITAT